MAEKCRKCNRPLEDPDSKRRGYGPYCWEIHLQDIQDDNVIYDKSHTTTVTSVDKSCKVEHSISYQLMEAKEECKTCHELLSRGHVMSYDSDEGVLVPGFGKPQRFYVRCDDCKHESYISLKPTFVKKLFKEFK